MLIIGDKYQLKPPRPFAPGGEIAGVVDAIGEDVEGWALGDRLITMINHGGLAESAILPASRGVRLPEGCNLLQGAALLITYGTSYHALVDRGELKADETLLVLAAGGGVGLAV